MSKKVEDFSVHCFLLAKGHYPQLKGVPGIIALRIILQKYANIDRGSIHDVWELVCKAFCRYVPDNIKERSMIEMYDWFGLGTSSGPAEPSYGRLISKMLGAIATTEVKDADFDVSEKLELDEVWKPWNISISDLINSKDYIGETCEIDSNLVKSIRCPECDHACHYYGFAKIEGGKKVPQGYRGFASCNKCQKAMEM